MTDTTTEAAARAARAIQDYPSRGVYTADFLRALATERDTLTARVKELEAENARLRKDIGKKQWRMNSNMEGWQ